MSDNARTGIALIPIVLVIVAFAFLVIRMRRKGYSQGDAANVVVRCRDGHLFTTIWIPLVSLKAVRLGPMRFQYCPVGDHWTLVVPVDESDLTDAERRFAAEHHDKRVP